MNILKINCIGIPFGRSHPMSMKKSKVVERGLPVLLLLMRQTEACRMMEQLWDEMILKYPGQLQLLKINVKHDLGHWQAVCLEKYPVTLFLSKSKVRDRINGALSPKLLEGWLQKLMRETN